MQISRRRRENRTCPVLSGGSQDRRPWRRRAQNLDWAAGWGTAYLSNPCRTEMMSPRLMQRGLRTRRDQFLCSSFGLRSTSSKSVSSTAGSLITYFSLAHAPRSRSLQRSLQNGNSALASESVGFLQMGQRNFMHLRIPQTAQERDWMLCLRPKNTHLVCGGTTKHRRLASVYSFENKSVTRE